MAMLIPSRHDSYGVWIYTGSLLSFKLDIKFQVIYTPRYIVPLVYGRLTQVGV